MRFNVAASAEFGEPHFVTEEAGSPFDIHGLTAEMGKALLSFDPAKDFVALSGPLPHVAILLSVASAAHERVRVLIFDARSSEYRSRELDISFVFDEEEVE
jgi:hypothetical protein